MPKTELKTKRAITQAKWRARNLEKCRAKCRESLKRHRERLEHILTPEQKFARRKKILERRRQLYRAKKNTESFGSDIQSAPHQKVLSKPSSKMKKTKRKPRRLKNQEPSVDSDTESSIQKLNEITINNSFSIPGTEFDNFVTVKSEPIEQFSVTEEISFCRCCFKSLNLSQLQHPIDDDLSATFQELTNIILSPCEQAPSFCDNCFNETQSFSNFRNLAIAKNEKFEEVSNKNGDISEIFSFRLPPNYVELKTEDDENSETVKYEELLDGNLLTPTECFDFLDPQVKNFEPSPKRPRGRPRKKTKVKTVEQLPKRSRGRSRKLNKVKPPIKPIVTMHSKQVAEQWPCDLCDHVSISKRAEKFHITRFHKDAYKDDLAFKCPTCSKTFLGRLKFETHLKNAHQRVKNVRCQLCDYATHNQKFMEVHIRNQHDAKSKICHICGKGFGAERLLQVHLMSHEEYLFECDLCPRKFKGKEGIQNHIKRVHLKILKHVCEICSKAFVTFAVLYVHKLNHQGVRFHCFVPGCTSAVTTKDVLLLHMRNNHILSREEQEDYKKKLQEYWNTIKPKKNFIWQSS